jgi:hypothetical protein
MDARHSGATVTSFKSLYPKRPAVRACNCGLPSRGLAWSNLPESRPTLLVLAEVLQQHYVADHHVDLLIQDDLSIFRC